MGSSSGGEDMRLGQAFGIASLLAAFASGASAGPIGTGDMLIPIVSSIGAPFGSIQERVPGPSFTLVQTIPLPTGYHYTTGQLTSVIVRSTDHHIFTNVLDTTSGGSTAAVLELDSTGAFVAVKDNSLPTGGSINQLRFDPLDPTMATMLAGVSGLSSHEVDAFNPDAGTQGTKFSLSGALFKGLALDSSSNIYASDAATGKVEKYSSAGAFIADFTTATSDHTLTGMDFDTLGNLYVGQHDSSDVLKYTSAGAFVAAYTGSGLIDLPTGVFFNPGDSLLYVPDLGSTFMIKMHTDGTSATATAMDSSAGGIGIPTIVPALTVPEPDTVGICFSGIMLLLLWRRHRTLCN
jgi:hypothetical protein